MVQGVRGRHLQGHGAHLVDGHVHVLGLGIKGILSLGLGGEEVAGVRSGGLGLGGVVLLFLLGGGLLLLLGVVLALVVVVVLLLGLFLNFVIICLIIFN